MSKLIITNPYVSMDAIKEHYGVLPKPWEWHLVPADKCIMGAPQGIETMRGVTVATNGIHYAVERWDGRLIVVHVLHFVPDEVDSSEHFASSPRAKKSDVFGGVNPFAAFV